jgi:DNA-binding NarL/FixJ family response regulator
MANERFQGMRSRTIRILFLDDNSFFTDGVVDQCEIEGAEYGIDARVVDNLDEATALVRSWCPDVILFDAYTAVAHSFELIARWKDVAFVVVMSECHSPEIELRILEAGASAFLPKSSSGEEIDRVLHELLLFVPEAPSNQ